MLTLCPPLQGLVVAVLYCFLNGEVSALGLPQCLEELLSLVLGSGELPGKGGREGGGVWAGQAQVS